MAKKKAYDALALALSTGMTNEDAAKQAGVSINTVYARLREPEFRQYVSQLRSQTVSRAVGKLVSSMSIATDTLRELLEDTKGSVRHSAARTMLELAVKLKESTEMEERLAALEQQQRELRGEQPLEGSLDDGDDQEPSNEVGKDATG